MCICLTLVFVGLQQPDKLLFITYGNKSLQDFLLLRSIHTARLRLQKRRRNSRALLVSMQLFIFSDMKDQRKILRSLSQSLSVNGPLTEIIVL